MAEQEINVALESSVEDVKTSIGATGNTGGSTTAGSIFGKLNKIIADLASHISSWTSARAGYIDTIKTNTDRLTSARATIIDNIGATGNTGGSATAGTVMAKLNALLTSWTSTRAGYVDRLANGTYGLDKIKSDTGSILSKVNSGVSASVKAIGSPKLVSGSNSAGGSKGKTDNFTLLNITGKGKLLYAGVQARVESTGDYMIFKITIDGTVKYNVKLSYTASSGYVNGALVVSDPKYFLQTSTAELGNIEIKYLYGIFESSSSQKSFKQTASNGNVGYLSPVLDFIEFNSSLKIEVTRYQKDTATTNTIYHEIAYTLD